jgi:transcriptional regulator
MGSYRQAELSVRPIRGESTETSPATLWSRGGKEGFTIEHCGQEIHLPHELLVEQVGNAMRQAAISRIEGMTGTQFLASLNGLR